MCAFKCWFMFVSFSVFLLVSVGFCSQSSKMKSSISSLLSKSWNQANHWLLLSFLIHVKIQYKEDLGGGTALPETPEMERVKRNQRNISTVLHRVTLPSFISHSTSIFPPYLVTSNITRPFLTCNLFKMPFSIQYRFLSCLLCYFFSFFFFFY